MARYTLTALESAILRFIEREQPSRRSVFDRFNYEYTLKQIQAAFSRLRRDKVIFRIDDTNSYGEVIYGTEWTRLDIEHGYKEVDSHE